MSPDLPTLARTLADEHCAQDASGTCAWYHGLWQFLRVTGIAASAARQQSLYRQAFASLAVELDETAEILVSGAADHAIFEQVVDACGHADVRPRITVLDRCATPLKLCEIWAASRALDVETITSDIFTLESPRRFDVICSHSFVGLFSPPERARLCAKWASLLKPGGAVVAVNRVRDQDPDQPLGMSEKSARELCSELDERLSEAQVAPDVHADAMARAAIYVRRQQVYPLSERELSERLAAAGLTVQRAWRMHSGDPRNAACEGVAVAANAHHACVVARPS